MRAVNVCEEFQSRDVLHLSLVSNAGFIIFLILTVATFYVRPAPLSLGRELIHTLENKWSHFGKDNLYDLVASAEAWEQHMVDYGSQQIKWLEDSLRSIKKQNIRDITDIGHILGSLRNKVSEYGSSGIEEVVYVKNAISNYSQAAQHDLEKLVYRSLASLVDATWPVHRWPMYIFTSGAMICLLTSAVCHLFGCCAPHIASIMWRFDYAGIAVLIVASFYPPVYYGFLCRPLLAAFYLGLTTIFGLSTLTVTLLDKFQDPAYHAFRAGLFSCLGLFGVIPLVHGWSLHGSVKEVSGAVMLDIVMGVIYLLGAAIYTFKVPERWKPGAFDVAFHSHQLFHVAVVIAAMIHYKACNLMMHWRDSTGGCLASAISS